MPGKIAPRLTLVPSAYAVGDRIEAQEKLERGQVLQVGVTFQGGIQLVDVALVMLGVVDLHGTRVDGRLERIECVRQLRQLEGHIDSCSSMSSTNRDTSLTKSSL